MSTIKRILVATDFGESSAKALALAVDLSHATGATLTLLHVVDYPTYSYAFEQPIDIVAQLQAAAETVLGEELVKLRKEVPLAEAALKRGLPSATILAFASERQTDLLVVGTHGRSGVSRWLLGSVAEKLVRLSPHPVLTVRGGPAEAHGLNRF